MAKHWIIEIGDHEYEVTEDREYFVKHSSAVKRGQDILYESFEDESIAAYLEAVKDDKPLDIALEGSFVRITPMRFRDAPADAEIDSKNCWMVSLISTNSPPNPAFNGSYRYYTTKAAALSEAVDMVREALEALKEFDESNGLEQEVERCREWIAKHKDDEDISYDDQLFDENSVYIQRLPFKDL